METWPIEKGRKRLYSLLKKSARYMYFGIERLPL